MDQLNKFITGGLVFVGVAVAMLSSPARQSVPQDPWFEHAVLKNPRTVVVKFGAEWCGPCRSMDGALDTLESQYAARARFLRTDVDKKPEVFDAFGRGSGIPQIMIFKDGQVVAHERGFGGRDQLNQWLAQNL